MKLFRHQEEGIEFLKEKGRAILADEMGLGKSRQAIMAIGEQDSTGILIICPASLKINWQREITAVYADDEYFVVDSGKKRKFPKVPWIIINYDLLGKYKEQIIELIENGELDTVIVDEAHYIKGKKTIRAKDTLEIVDKVERVYLLTGTPIMNRPIELFNLLKAIKHPLSKGRSLYSQRYCNGHLVTIPRRTGIIRFWDESGASRLPELREAIKDVFLRRTKKEVLNLPEKIVTIQICEMKPEWKRLYDTAWDNYVEWVSNNPEGKDIENILSAQQLVELGKLKQVCSQSKVKQIAEDIENAVEQEEKVIVFSQYTKTIENLKLEMEDKGIVAVTLTGQDDQHQRQRAVDLFQNDPSTKVFIANIKAGGVGLNLTAGTIVMFADMEWSPEIHNQAEDRAHRIGTKEMVNIYYYIVKDTIEEDIVAILEEKKEIIKEVMQGTDNAVSGNSMAKEFMNRLGRKLGKSR